MIFAIFQLLIGFSFANQNVNHHHSKRYFNAQFNTQKNTYSTSFLKDASTEPVCESPPTGFDLISDGVEISGNSYACNQYFTKPISISSHLLIIHHCRFAYFDKSLPISIQSVSESENIIISNSDFYSCKKGSISLINVNPDITISQCSFNLCQNLGDSIIQFNSNSGTIENCYFCNNLASQDINYDPPSGENSNLTVKGCTFEHFFDSSNFLNLKEGSRITLQQNNFNIWGGNCNIFSNPISSPDSHIIQDNYMYPFDSQKIGTTNLPDDAIFDPEDNLECPMPEDVPIHPDHYFCGNIGDPSDSTLLASISFVQVYYSSFDTIKNVNGNGGAVFLSIPNQPSIAVSNSIKFYHSVFTNCQSLNGCAVYIESSDVDRLFDFNYCTFHKNSYKIDYRYNNNGGGIYIKSSVSCFEFTNCLFNENGAKNGGGICFISDETSSSDANVNRDNFALKLNDCYFQKNSISEAGGAVYINVTSDASPRPIEVNRCTFISNKESDDISEADYEYGASIYYSLNCQPSNEPAEISNIDNCLRVYDCIFSLNSITNFGGAICISITNNEPSKPIEIVKCQFRENKGTFVIQDSTKIEGYGGAICYILDKTSVSNNDSPSLYIHNCVFTNNYAYAEGGSILISVQNAQSSRSIEIYNCTYNYDESILIATDGPPQTMSGGFISYLIESSSESPSNNNPPLHINNCSFSSNIDTFKGDTSGRAEEGGCIYIDVKNSQQTGTIEINDCYFSHIKSTAEESYGGSIYYVSNAASSSTPSHTALSISNCQFVESDVRNLGGSIYIIFENDESQKQIEITGCTFQNTKSTPNNNAIYINSNNKANTVKLNDCTFESCMVYFETLSSTIENCRFNEIDSDKYAIYYKKSSNDDFEATISVDKCTFIQTNSEVDSLVYFATVLSSVFSFTNNVINFTGNESHVLGCQKGFEIQKEEEKWIFKNNTIDPNEEVVIKTTNAVDIPATCGVGFSCIAIPKNCEGNSRCELILPDGQNSIELIDKEYVDLKDVDYGGAIQLVSVILTCKNSSFTGCEATIGGGAIYIVVKDTIANAPSSFLIEKGVFTSCRAKFGGAIYIYNNQQDCHFTIKRCTFERNAADTSATIDGKDHLFGGSAIYLQTKTAQILRCTFRKNAGSGVKIFHEDNIDPPFDGSESSSSSLKLNSKDEKSIQIKDCFFEADKFASSSSLFYLREGKKQFPINVIDCTFVGELPQGSYHIDGNSILNKKDKLKIKIEKCKFASDKKLALNSKLNVMSFDVNSQKFNLKDGIENVSNKNDNRNEQQHLKKQSNSKIEFNLITVAAVAISAVAAISIAVIIIVIKKNNLQKESTNNDEVAIEENAAEL